MLKFNLRVKNIAQDLAFRKDTSKEDPLIVLVARKWLAQQDLIPTERSMPTAKIHLDPI